MRVIARFVPEAQAITIRQAMVHPSQAREHTALTVLLTNVVASKSLQGEMVEENERPLKPHREVAGWPKLRYVDGHYVDMHSGEVVEKAKAVYMVGPKAFYLPA